MSPLFGLGVKVLSMTIITAIILLLLSSASAAVEITQEQQQQLMSSTLDIDNDAEEPEAVALTDPRSGHYSSENVQKIPGKGISQLEIFGDSMLPTLGTGDIIYIATNETFETIEPGKVVVFRTLDDAYQSIFVAHRIQELSPTMEDNTTTLWLASGDAEPGPNFNDLVLKSNYIGTALEVAKGGTNFAEPIEPAPPKSAIITTMNENEEGRDTNSNDDDESISDTEEIISNAVLEEESGSDGDVDTLLSEEDDPSEDESSEDDPRATTSSSSGETPPTPT